MQALGVVRPQAKVLDQQVVSANQVVGPASWHYHKGAPRCADPARSRLADGMPLSFRRNLSSEGTGRGKVMADNLKTEPIFFASGTKI